MGPKRRQQLLKQFGGLRGLARARVEDITEVNGISRQLAQQIYDALITCPRILIDVERTQSVDDAADLS